MISKNFRLDSWDWDLTVFLDTRQEDARLLVRTLRENGCGGRNLRRALRNLRSGELNTGLTYTDGDDRRTVMIVSHASGPAEFWNTLDHEKNHVAEHIATTDYIDRKGEEFSYLHGELAQRLYPIARTFICTCSRRGPYQ